MPEVTGSGRYPEALLQSAEALTEFVASDKGFEETMQRLAQLATHAVDGADGCAVSIIREQGKKMQNVAATPDRARLIDDLQTETGEGPCLSSIEDVATFHIADMSSNDDWPTFCRRALDETGTKSMLCFVLRLSNDATGAMNLLSSETDAFSDEDLETGTIFAAQAAVAMSNALEHGKDLKRIENLEGGMASRQVIGQAVGILMASRHVDSDEAFAILTKVSQNSNIKLREVAEKVVEESGEA